MRTTPLFTLLLTSPLPWAVIAGLLVGAAASRATMRTRGHRDPERAKTWKWVLVCIFLSLAVVFVLAGLFLPGPGKIFLPGPGKIFNMRLAYAGGAAAVLVFFALRFKKAVGIPVVVLILVSVSLFGLFFRSIRAFTGETEIATVRVISAESGGIRLELIPRGEEPVLLSMAGQYFAPVVKVVIFDDLFVFLGAKTWYRFDGMTSFALVKETDGDRFRQQNTDYYFPWPAGISETLWQVFEKNGNRIPGVKTVQVEMDLKRVDAEEFATYGIMVQNDGGVQIVAKKSP